jgi:hypothetical protein
VCPAGAPVVLPVREKGGEDIGGTLGLRRSGVRSPNGDRRPFAVSYVAQRDT